MKEIQQVLSDIESIKLSLEALSNKGISIIDTFAPITTSVNIITTIFATAFGGWVTIQLFKRQEKMRIREELRLDFYKNYKKIYKKLADKLREIDLLMLTFDERCSISFEDKFDELIDLIFDYTFELNQHYSSNKRIIGKEYEYFEEGGKIKEIYECYEEYQGSLNAWGRLGFKNEIQEIIDDLTTLNNKIEDDFINLYFEEKKWYEYIINPFKKKK